MENKQIINSTVVPISEYAFSQSVKNKMYFFPKPKSMNKEIKYIFFYRIKPIQAITHYGIIKKHIEDADKMITLIEKMKTFRELGLSDEVMGTLEDLGIKIPSEIQEKTIPLVLAGRDVIGGSATGSGKTLAFASGMVENVENFIANLFENVFYCTNTTDLALDVILEAKSANIAHFDKVIEDKSHWNDDYIRQEGKKLMQSSEGEFDD